MCFSVPKVWSRSPTLDLLPMWQVIECEKPLLAHLIGWHPRSWAKPPTPPKWTSGPSASWPSRCWMASRPTWMRLLSMPCTSFDNEASLPSRPRTWVTCFQTFSINVWRWMSPSEPRPQSCWGMTSWPRQSMSVVSFQTSEQLNRGRKGCSEILF